MYTPIQNNSSVVILDLRCFPIISLKVPHLERAIKYKSRFPTLQGSGVKRVLF